MSGKSSSKAADNATSPGAACHANLENTKPHGNARKNRMFSIEQIN